MSSQKLDHSIVNGKATVEVWCTHPHPDHGPIVQPGPGKYAGWQRREVNGVYWSRRAQGYIVDFVNGSGGWYAERHVRNLQPLVQG
jgi:hypothetical protein